MAYDSTDQLIQLLADRWYKESDGNLYKLLDSFTAPLEIESDVGDKIEDWRQIKDAEGTTLDLIGEDHKAYRPTQDDDPYRFLIYIKMLMARAQGTAPSIVHIAGTALQNDQGFKIWRTSVRHVAISIPFSMMTELPMQKFILENLQKLLALGIWLDYIELPMQSAITGYVGGVDVVHHVRNLTAPHPIWWSGWSAEIHKSLYLGKFTVTEESYTIAAPAF